MRIKKEKKNKRFGVRKVEEKGKGIRVEVLRVEKDGKI